VARLPKLQKLGKKKTKHIDLTKRHSWVSGEFTSPINYREKQKT